MKILYFSRNYTTHDHRFLSSLADTDNEVTYLRLECRGHSLEDRPIPHRIRQIDWVGGKYPFTWKDIPKLYQDLKRVIQFVKPDLIQSGPLQTAALLVALTGYKPLVSMSWGYDLLVEADRNAMMRWATQYTLRQSAVMIGDCDTIRQKAIDHGMPNERIVTFPWGLDIEHFTPLNVDQSNSITKKPTSLRERYGWGDDDFVLLSTRGWEPIYGVALIAQAFTVVAKKKPDLRLLMIGDGSQAHLVHKIFTNAGVIDRVHFAGQVSQVDLPQYYQAADLYISASHSDGSSISLLEALACGCPVLVSDIPGNREWIDPGVHGWWFKDGNLNDLVHTIVNVINTDQHKLAQMAQSARNLAVVKADWEKNFPFLLKAYEQALTIA